MNWTRMIFLVSIWLSCADSLLCRALWADEQKPFWNVPLIQQVRVPAGVQAGVFYPEHDEMVIVKPGAWAQVKAPAQENAGDVVIPPKTEEEPIRLTIKGHMKLSEALQMIADAKRQHLVIGPGVEDRDISLDIKDEPPEDALHSAFIQTEYGSKTEASDLVILARDTRMFRLNLPPVIQSFNTATTNESSSVASSSSNGAPRIPGEGRVRVGAKVIVENSSGALSYWQDIESNVKSLASAAGVVSFNRAAGVVMVTDTPCALERIAGFFSEINARASEQIQVDVKVVEVALSREQKLGIDWAAIASQGALKGLDFKTNFASENMTTGNMLTFSGRMNKDGSGDTESGVKAVLKALESFGKVEVVSQPRVMMLNNSVASIQVGETRSYVESTNIETTQGGATIASATLNEVHGGITLELVGSIVGDDVFLSVTPVVSAIDDIRTIALGGGNKLEAPDTSMKTMSTLVRVRSGKTVAIGGLITRERSREHHGVPFLSKIPILGKAFSYESNKDRRVELVIFMTPRRG